MCHVDNVCSSVKPYPSNVEDFLETTASVHGQMNESLSLQSTQKLQKHLIKRSPFGHIESNPKSKRDITGTTRFMYFIHIVKTLIYYFFEYIFVKEMYTTQELYTDVSKVHKRSTKQICSMLFLSLLLSSLTECRIRKLWVIPHSQNI